MNRETTVSQAGMFFSAVYVSYPRYVRTNVAQPPRLLR